jgi:uncharacterized protein YndB with AHSA1/START domain
VNGIEDGIRKQALLPAPRERVWHAVSDAKQFGEWFGVAFDGAFQAGQRSRGRIVPTRMDPEIAKLQKPYEGTPFEITVEAIEPERRIVFRWHPFAIDKDVDYSREPMTTVSFQLEDADKGTRLTITEEGFGSLPAGRREAAYAANEGGWTHQLRLIRKYVDVQGG